MTIIPTPVPRWPFRRTTNCLAQPAVGVQRATAFERFRAAHPEFVQRLTADAAHRTRQLNQLGLLTQNEQRDHIRKLLRDRKLHRLYAYHAIRQSRRLGNSTPETVMELATSFNAFAPVRHEPFALRLVTKGNGRRWVHDFGLRRRMHQKLVADILRQIHPPPRTQTLFTGGMPVARTAIAAAYCDGGFTHGVEVDIVRFYDSVRHPALAELLRPLPTSVVDNVVWDIAMRDDPSTYAVVGTTPTPTSSASTGLSFGSATSPIVGETILAELLARAGEADTITYADNLFVMGRSHGEVEARIDRIRESATLWSEVGSLELREGASFGYDLTQPFEFLRQEGLATEGGIEWRPGADQRARYQVGDSETHLDDLQISMAEQRVRHWRRSYKDWPEGDAQEAVYLAELAVHRFYNNGNASNRTAAVHAVIVAWLATGQDRAWWELLPDGGSARHTRRTALIEELQRWVAIADAAVAA